MLLRNSVLLATLLSLTGCATLFGDAVYTYEKTSDDNCTIRIDSRRSLTDGATLAIVGCDVTVNARSLDANANRDLALFNLLQSVVLPITGVKPVAPAQTAPTEVK